MASNSVRLAWSGLVRGVACGVARKISKVALVAVAAMLLVTGDGCKTQDDAVAAATQMAETAKALSVYYAALDKTLAATQDSYQAQYALMSVPVDKPEQIIETRRQIQLRAGMATEISKLAELFQQLAGSQAGSDASTAAGKLNAELVDVKAIGKNDTETQAVTEGVKQIVLLLQQHEERRAAQLMVPLSSNLWKFFQSEQGLYAAINETYLNTARSVATYMVQKDQVNVSPVFASALRPFSLAPAVSIETVRTGMQIYLTQQIDTRYMLKLAESQKATAAMSDSLKEMIDRLTLVAASSPMRLRLAPLSLETVRTWAEGLSK